VAQRQLFDPQDNDEPRRGESLAKKARRAEQRAQWLLHYVKAEEEERGRKAKAKRAELILPPGLQRDAGIEHFLARYHTDPEFHAKIEEAVRAALEPERQKNILNAKGHVIFTEDGQPANTAAAFYDEMVKIRTWAEIEKLALNEQERQEEAERALICIWCGKVCEDADDLAIHEDDCA
jgi:hypothetical protein